MGKKLHLIGQVFGKLTVIAQSETKKSTMWLCSCECGNQKIIVGSRLVNGNSRSCGCLCGKTSHPKHKMSHSKIYYVWAVMKDRCNNSKNKNYHHYGARGISVCPEWSDFIVFNSWAITNGYEIGLTIDRKNNDGNYEPDNCRWVNQTHQNRNKRNTILIDHNDTCLTIKEWSELTGIGVGTLFGRYSAGYSSSKILSTINLKDGREISITQDKT